MSITWRLVFLSFSFSISSGLCFLHTGHALLHMLGFPGFALPAFTSSELGAIGGLFLALPILLLRSLPQEISDSFHAPFPLTLFAFVVIVGAAQGYVGAQILRGYKRILGVGCASIAGATGALMLVLFLACIILLASFTFRMSPEPPRRNRERNTPAQ